MTSLVLIIACMFQSDKILVYNVDVYPQQNKIEKKIGQMRVEVYFKPIKDGYQALANLYRYKEVIKEHSTGRRLEKEYEYFGQICGTDEMIWWKFKDQEVFYLDRNRMKKKLPGQTGSDKWMNTRFNPEWLYYAFIGEDRRNPFLYYWNHENKYYRSRTDEENKIIKYLMVSANGFVDGVYKEDKVLSLELGKFKDKVPENMGFVWDNQLYEFNLEKTVTFPHKFGDGVELKEIPKEIFEKDPLSVKARREYHLTYLAKDIQNSFRNWKINNRKAWNIMKTLFPYLEQKHQPPI